MIISHVFGTAGRGDIMEYFTVFPTETVTVVLVKSETKQS